MAAHRAARQCKMSDSVKISCMKEARCRFVNVGKRLERLCRGAS